MIKHLSLALVAALCVAGGTVQANPGCDIGCTAVVSDGCQDCGGHCHRGCGRLFHGNWLCRKSHGGCDACDACGGGNLWDGYDACGGGHCGHGRCHGRHCRIEGLDRYFNCGCNGSYNYPVPPLYTYHWPGMYKAQRMTDYQSPWRFPPLRPYTEETLSPLIEETPAPRTMTMAPVFNLRTVSATMTAEASPEPTGNVESVSSRLQRMGSR